MREPSDDPIQRNSFRGIVGARTHLRRRGSLWRMSRARIETLAACARPVAGAEGRGQEAPDHLAAAARRAPANARFAYVYAVALNDAGRNGEALAVLEDDVARHPYDRDSLAALANFYRSAGNPDKAASYARRLAELQPSDTQVR